ncbi:MAG: FG-GAP repeat domain-containing protein [Vicinamibacterales bacterium]
MGNTCSDTTVGVLVGRGDGTFEPVVTMSPGGNSATSVAIADVNGDGKPDLLVPFGVGSVGILLGTGDGRFEAPILVQTDGISNSIAIADINIDGHPDLLLAGFDFVDGDSEHSGLSRGVVRVLLGNGDGSFQPEAVFNSGVSPGGWANSVAVADLDGDGQLDLAVADYPDNATGVLLGDGTSFKPVVLYGSGAALSWFEAIADVNGDGKPDLIVADFAGTVGVLLGNGDGTFQTAQDYPVSGDATSVVAADVTGDGRPDLIVSNGNNSVSVLLNTSGCDQTPPAITVSTAPRTLWPPNGKTVPVTVSGSITDAGCTVDPGTVAYTVHDEYGPVQTTGPLEVRADGSYSFTVLLQASRQGGDRDGRQYTITVRAANDAGIGASQKAIVTVPHDQR